MTHARTTLGTAAGAAAAGAVDRFGRAVGPMPGPAALSPAPRADSAIRTATGAGRTPGAPLRGGRALA